MSVWATLDVAPERKNVQSQDEDDPDQHHKECLGSNALAYKKKTVIWFPKDDCVYTIWFPKEDRDLNLQGNAKHLTHKHGYQLCKWHANRHGW